jgi:hypothetical protein
MNNLVQEDVIQDDAPIKVRIHDNWKVTFQFQKVPKTYSLYCTEFEVCMYYRQDIQTIHWTTTAKGKWIQADSSVICHTFLDGMDDIILTGFSARRGETTLERPFSGVFYRSWINPELPSYEPSLQTLLIFAATTLETANMLSGHVPHKLPTYIASPPPQVTNGPTLRSMLGE